LPNEYQDPRSITPDAEAELKWVNMRRFGCLVHL
jgi:hypothetical protein